MNKLWTQVQHYDSTVAAYLNAINPAGVKWLEYPRDEMQKVKDNGGINIVRIATLTGNLDVFEVCGAIQSHALQYGSLVDYYELTNEPDISTYAKWLALRDFSLSCINRLSQKIIVGNISEGNLPLTADWWTPWEATLQALMAKGGMFGQHEYGAPTMKACAPWHVLRYREAYKVLPTSVKNVEWFIGECGIDGGVTGGQHTGYQGFGGESVFTPDLQWYEGEINQDNGNGRPNVRGAAIFLLGHYDPWASFDIVVSTMIRALLAGETPPVPEGNVATDFTVGEGVRNEMAKRNDAPLTDEHYVSNIFSITQGSLGVYLYFPQSNTVTFLPKG